MITKTKNFSLNISNLKNSLPFEMIWVEPGSIVMGNTDVDLYMDDMIDGVLDVMKWKVRLTQGYWLAKYPLTQSQWNNFNEIESITENYKLNKYMQEVSRPYKESLTKYSKKNNFPICGRNWIDAILFCRELNVKFKKLIPKGYHFNLPTEAQWEYAAVSNGKSPSIISNHFDLYKLEKIADISNLNINGWGFCDMIGNQRELCFDYAHSYYDFEELDEFTLKKDEWHTDWNPNLSFPVLHDYSFPNEMLLSALRQRIVKGLFHPAYRESAFVEKAEYSFRVALRPITEPDLKDPILKLNNIDILGNDKNNV